MRFQDGAEGGVSRSFGEVSGGKPDDTDGPTAPLSLRLSAADRAILERQAAGLSLGEHIRRCVFDENRSRRRTRGTQPVVHEISGFMSDTLPGALQEAYAVREQWQQPKRLDEDPRMIKSALKECWAISDSRNAFIQALDQRGYYMAKGDRRGYVAVDWRGEVYSLPRWLDLIWRPLNVGGPTAMYKLLLLCFPSSVDDHGISSGASNH